MSVFRRILGMGPAAVKTPESYVSFTSESGDTRMRMVPDMSANAIASRYNQQMIYGKDNVPPEFGMKGVIEVKGEDGKFQPVTGSRRGVPNMEAQMAALSNYQETGVIGPAPQQDAGGAGVTRPQARPETTAPSSSQRPQSRPAQRTEFDEVMDRLPSLLSQPEVDSVNAALSPEPVTTTTLPPAEQPGLIDMDTPAPSSVDDASAPARNAPATTAPAQPSTVVQQPDLRDDQKARRGFGRSSYLDGLINQGNTGSRFGF